MERVGPGVRGQLPSRWKLDLAQWIPAVNEQLATGDERVRDPIQGAFCDHGMTTVQRADSHSERKVVLILVGGEHEVFAGHGAHAENTGVDEILCRTDELLDGFRGPIDGEYVPIWGDTTCDLAGRGARPAADLDDAHASPKRKSINDRSKAWRQLRHKQHCTDSSHHEAVSRAGVLGQLQIG
jgi:hypothetical protein